MRQVKVVVERHPDGYVAYPLGLNGVVVSQGDTSEEALADVTSAIRFHVETFGDETSAIRFHVETFGDETFDTNLLDLR